MSRLMGTPYMEQAISPYFMITLSAQVLRTNSPVATEQLPTAQMRTQQEWTAKRDGLPSANKQGTPIVARVIAKLLIQIVIVIMNVGNLMIAVKVSILLVRQAEVCKKLMIIIVLYVYHCMYSTVQTCVQTM